MSVKFYLVKIDHRLFPKTLQVRASSYKQAVERVLRTEGFVLESFDRVCLESDFNITVTKLDLCTEYYDIYPDLVNGLKSLFYFAFIRPESAVMRYYEVCVTPDFSPEYKIYLNTHILPEHIDDILSALRYKEKFHQMSDYYKVKSVKEINFEDYKKSLV